MSAMNLCGTLMKYEWRKLWGKRIVRVTIVVMLALQIFGNLEFLIHSSSGVMTDESGQLVEMYAMNGYESLLNNKRVARLMDGRTIDGIFMREVFAARTMREDVAYQKMKSVIRNLFFAGTQYGESFYDWTQKADTEEMYLMWRGKLRQSMENYYLTQGERAYWEERTAKIQTPFTYRNCLGWQEMLDMAAITEVLTFMLIAICLSGVFSDEHRLKTDQMILSMKNGRNQLYAAKMIVGVLFGIASVVVMYAITFAIQFCLYGADGFDAVLQLKCSLAPFALTIGQTVMILFGMTALAAILESVFAMFLSERLRGSVAVLAVMVGIMLLTADGAVPARWRVLSQILSFVPTAFVSLWVSDCRLVPIPGGYLTCLQTAAVLYPLLTVIVVWLGRRRHQRYQVQL